MSDILISDSKYSCIKINCLLLNDNVMNTTSYDYNILSL